MILVIYSSFDVTSYNLPVRDIVEEDEVTKHGDEADETKSSNNIYDGVF